MCFEFDKMVIATCKVKKLTYLLASRTDFKTTGPVYNTKVLNSVPFHLLLSLNDLGFRFISHGI